MLKKEFIETCNLLGRNKCPFIFIADFELNRFQVLKEDQAEKSGIFYETPEFSLKPHSSSKYENKKKLLQFDIEPVKFDQYLQSFEFVKKHILHGNSFLLNLTFPTKILTNLSLNDIFILSSAKYKLLFKDQFVVFSPETFVKIQNGTIKSNPMKGTMDASLKNAEKLLLSNEKELWEHNTIVDLIRNDLSIVAKNVKVTRSRYIECIKTHKNELLQMSSEISGELPGDWNSKLGDIMISLLPAGSISGAPKRKTLEIIAKAEKKPRGYFTGVFGLYNGFELDSAVMIRFIENTSSGLQFRSGGGITGHSNPENEYSELLNKVYVPII